MSDSPKSFRDMAFPPSRDGTNAIYAPLPPTPPPKTITAMEADKRAQQLREMRHFIDNQKCPVCDAQLDGSIGYDRATVYCRAGGEKEYRAHYTFGIEIPIRSVATYYTTQYAFEINNNHITDGLYKNVIYKIDLSYNERYQQAEKKCILDYEGERLLLGGNLTEEQLMSKIKLYTLFS